MRILSGCFFMLTYCLKKRIRPVRTIAVLVLFVFLSFAAVGDEDSKKSSPKPQKLEPVRAKKYQGGELIVPLNGSWLAGGGAQTRPKAGDYATVQVPAYVHTVKTPEGVRVKSYHGRGKKNEIFIPGVWYRKQTRQSKSYV